MIAAKAICFGEALKPEFKAYQEQVVKNAAALAAALQKEGFKVLTGGTDNHLMLLDLRGMDISGKELQNRCDEVYITLNKNTVPNDPQEPVCHLRRPYRHTSRHDEGPCGERHERRGSLHLAGSHRL